MSLLVVPCLLVGLPILTAFALELLGIKAKADCHKVYDLYRIFRGL